MICLKGQLRSPWLGHKYPYSYPVPWSLRLVCLFLNIHCKKGKFYHVSQLHLWIVQGFLDADEPTNVRWEFQPPMHWVMSMGPTADGLSNEDKLSWFSCSLTASCFINNKTKFRKWSLNGQYHARLAVLFNWRPRQIFLYNFQNVKFPVEMNF